MAFRCLFQRRYDFSVEGYVVTDENELNYEILVERVDYLAGELQGLAEDVHLYHEIFEDAEAVEMLNKTAPRLFLRFQRATKDAVFSAIFRITDAAEFGEGEEQRKIFRSNAFGRIFKSFNWVPVETGSVLAKPWINYAR